MSLPAGQRRELDRIERTLLEDDRRLAALFATFTHLTSHEAMPWAERLMARPRLLRPRLRAVTAMVFGLAALTIALVVALVAPGSPVCPDRAVPVLAGSHSVRGSQRASCPAPRPARMTHAAGGRPRP